MVEQSSAPVPSTLKMNSSWEQRRLSGMHVIELMLQQKLCGCSLLMPDTRLEFQPYLERC